MNRKLFLEIVQLALAQKKVSNKGLFLLRGLLFYPFLVRDARKFSSHKQETSSVSAAGDDIYPLF